MTAVEWLENKCSEFETIYDSLPTRLYEYIEQAKEIEKQQQENIYERERFRAVDFAKWFSDFNGLTWEEKRVTKECLDTLYEKYLGTLGGGL
jgi:predicted phage-related endonuclease